MKINFLTSIVFILVFVVGVTYGMTLGLSTVKVSAVTQNKPFEETVTFFENVTGIGSDSAVLNNNSLDQRVTPSVSPVPNESY